MKRLIVPGLPILFFLLASVQAQACRIPPRPSALLNIEADAIVLALVTRVQGDGATWEATAVSRGTLTGQVRERVFGYGSGRPGETLITSCDQNWQPKLGRYFVLYLRRTGDGLRVHRGYPYWWAKASRDPRLARLDRLLPLGAVRQPTAEEASLLDLVEERLKLPAEGSALSGYTRVYARMSPSWVTGRLIRSRKPRRLIVDTNGEFPTEETCGCKLVDCQST